MNGDLDPLQWSHISRSTYVSHYWQSAPDAGEGYPSSLPAVEQEMYAFDEGSRLICAFC
jgi:hypothetical protein